MRSPEAEAPLSPAGRVCLSIRQIMVKYMPDKKKILCLKL